MSEKSCEFRRLLSVADWLMLANTYPLSHRTCSAARLETLFVRKLSRKPFSARHLDWITAKCNTRRSFFVQLYACRHIWRERMLMPVSVGHYGCRECETCVFKNRRFVFLFLMSLYFGRL